MPKDKEQSLDSPQVSTPIPQILKKTKLFPKYSGTLFQATHSAQMSAYPLAPSFPQLWRHLKHTKWQVAGQHKNDGSSATPSLNQDPEIVKGQG